MREQRLLRGGAPLYGAALIYCIGLLWITIDYLGWGAIFSGASDWPKLPAVLSLASALLLVALIVMSIRQRECRFAHVVFVLLVLLYSYIEIANLLSRGSATIGVLGLGMVLAGGWREYRARAASRRT